MTAREVARRVLDRVDKDGAWATPALDGELARAGLDERDRRLAAELVYGVLRHRTRIDRALAAHADLERTPPRVLTALRVAAYQLLFLDRVPAYAAVDDAVAAAREVGGAEARRVRERGAAQARRRARAARCRPSRRERIEIEHSLPRWIVDELAASRRRRRARRASPRRSRSPRRSSRARNRRRTTRDALIDAARAPPASTATPVARSAPMALALDGLGDPARSPSFIAGLWTVQDAGAQLVGARRGAARRASASSTRAPASAASRRTSPSSPTTPRTIDAADQLDDQARPAARETARAARPHARSAVTRAISSIPRRRSRPPTI